MKKILTLILCLLYTIVTFGGSVFVHNCGEEQQVSIYEKSSHDTCPICAQKDMPLKKGKDCKSGSCKDIEVKIDQLTDKLFSSNKAEKFNINPIIFERLWLDTSVFYSTVTPKNPIAIPSFYYSKTSPPAYILHCNFRN